mgnify:CR=1 FL=1
MIKIITGWSNQGGSTTAFVNLCNLFNENGIDCTLYGGQDWHLDKCRSGKLEDIEPIEDGDIIISHFCHAARHPSVKKHILSLHEKDLFPLKNLDLSQYDCVQFLNEQQRDWHLKDTEGDVDHVIIPNVYDPLKKNKKPHTSRNVAGIIGSVDKNKNTHISIEKAIKEGNKKVMLFGKVTDFDYFKSSVEPLLNENVVLAGYIEDKQKMYDMVDTVYLSSDSECAPLVKGECKLTGTKFRGNENTRGAADPAPKEAILAKWKRCLEL